MVNIIAGVCAWLFFLFSAYWIDLYVETRSIIDLAMGIMFAAFGFSLIPAAPNGD